MADSSALVSSDRNPSNQPPPYSSLDEQVNTAGKDMVFRDAVRAPLDETELGKYQQYVATQRQIQSSLMTGDGRQPNEADDVIDGDEERSSESEDEKLGNLKMESTRTRSQNRKESGLLRGHDLLVSAPRARLVLRCGENAV